MSDTITRVDGSDAGCWIDGHWGIYGPARVIAIARNHGMVLADTDRQIVDAWHASIDNGEAISDVADDAETWLNDNVAPDGFMFGWHDGEFFLSSDEWWEEEQALS